jgi:sigma-B regulation protein RsbU (phosphoserine phosphatase)
VPIGLLEDREYEEVTVPVQADDVLLFYSDGVEDQLADHEEYGRARLEKLFADNYAKPPDEIVKAVFHDLDEFRGANPLTDDQTVLALRVF